MSEQVSAEDPATPGRTQMDTTEKKEDGPEYPDLYKRVIIMVSLYLAMFLIILVNLPP
ncbi:hypothetical protein AUP68_14280 [Ilyonectria robusta]